MNKFLNYYIEKFRGLNRSVTVNGPAPHKPVLLLAVISQMSSETFHENNFEKNSLTEYFKKIWQSIVITGHKMDIEVPFAHLRSEGFWHLNDTNNASLDQELYQYLQVENGRKTLANLLLEEYFWNNHNAWSEVLQILHSSDNAKKMQQDLNTVPILVDEIISIDVSTQEKCQKGTTEPISIDKKKDELLDLGITPSCRKALHEFGIYTCEEFCNCDLDEIAKMPSIGISKLHQMRDIQKKLQRDSSDANNNDEDKQLYKRKSFYRFYLPTKIVPRYGDVEFLQLPLREIVMFYPHYKFIGDIPFDKSVKNILRGLAFFDFDPSDMLLETTLEYFVLSMPKRIWDIFWDNLGTVGSVSEKCYFIAKDNIFTNKTLDFCFTDDILDNDSLQLLQQNNIFTFADYNVYINCSHALNSDFISIALLHQKNALKFKELQYAFDSIPDRQLIGEILGSQDERALAIFRKRIGEKLTLESLSIEFDITRERVRQISKSFDDLLFVKKVDYNFSNPLPLNTFYMYLKILFAINGGALEITYLQSKLQNWLKDDDDFSIVLYFIKMNFESVQKNNCIFIPTNKCLRCEILKKAFIQKLQEQKIINYDQICSIIQDKCMSCPQHICHQYHAFVPIFFDMNLQGICTYDYEEQCLYDNAEYGLRKGSSKDIVAILFAKTPVMTFEEFFERLSVYKPDISERAAYGYVQKADVVLAARGKYMLRSTLPQLSADLFNQIVTDILARLQRNINMLFSLNVIYKKYQMPLMNAQCSTAYMLFEILKQKQPSGIRFIKCPYVTHVENTDKFSVSNLLEEYIAENGTTPVAVVRDFFCKELGVSQPVFTLSYNQADQLIVDDDNNLIHIDDLNISPKKIQPFVEHLDAIGDTETITVNKIFSETEVSCLMLGIKGPKMLFNILRHFVGDKFSFRYPQISKNSENIVAIRQKLIDFIKDTQSFCTRDQLEEYCRKEHLSDRNLYLNHELYPELFYYLPATWVHVDTIGYNFQWIEQVSLIAEKVLNESPAPKKSYSYLDVICEYEDELPALACDELFWTNTLIGEILEASGKFLVYGKYKSVFSAKTDGNNLHNFGDLCALLLDEEFGGAANLKEFSSYLRSKDLISSSDLHDSLLQGSQRIVIDGMEVYTQKEQIHA